MLRRSLGREQTVADIDDDAVAAAPRIVIATCRPGLEDILLGSFDAADAAEVIGPGRVLLRSAGPLRRLGQARTLLTLGFPLQRAALRRDRTRWWPADVAALTGPEAQEIFGGGRRDRFAIGLRGPAAGTGGRWCGGWRRR
jgi:hypothetical protein